MKPSEKDAARAWVQARVDEAGSIDTARPVGEFTCQAWRALCRELGVTVRAKRANTLEAALEAVARLAQS